jgi:hypothetical protein
MIPPIEVALGVVVLVPLLVIPGFALEARTPRAELHGTAPFLRAFVGSIALVTAAGALLLATGMFSALGLAIVALAVGIVGLVPFLRWMRATLRAVGRVELIVLGALLAMLVPWALTAIDPGLPRSSTFEWYYWQVGRQLSDAQGIPSAVPEYGGLVRWLPDYLGFNLLSEAFRGSLPFVADLSLISAWRIPMALGGFVGLYLVLRLWIRTASALVGVGAIATTTLFVTKFNVYKPESLGILVGLAALWLLVQGARHGKPSMILWAGAAIGLAVNVHAIAAVVFGLLMAAGGLVELAQRRGGRLALIRTFAAASALAVVLVVALGWSLQGRAAVISDALRPTLNGGNDPTWTYLRRSNGDFSGRRLPPRLIDEVAISVSRPWPNEPIVAGRNVWLIGVGGAGLLLALAFGSSRLRSGVAVGLLGGILLSSVMLAFALAFETYVPRHTGLGRMGQYVPLFAGTVLGFAAGGYEATWRRITGRRPAVVRSLLAVAVGVGLAVPYLNAVYYAGDTRITPTGRDALEALRTMAAPGDVAISNAVTFGTLEFFAGVEAPFEGRQPLIEDPKLLDDVNALLIALNRYLASPLNGNAVVAIESLGARWLVIVDDPASLGADDLFGGFVARFEGDPTVRLAWQAERIAIFESTLPHATAAKIQPARPRPLRFAAAAAAAALAAIILAVVAEPARGRRAVDWLRAERRRRESSPDR